MSHTPRGIITDRNASNVDSMEEYDVNKNKVSISPNKMKSRQAYQSVIIDTKNTKRLEKENIGDRNKIDNLKKVSVNKNQ